MSLRSDKTVEIVVYLNFLFVDGRIRILEAQVLMDPTDPAPDSEHC
jgi:hypothetical protein